MRTRRACDDTNHFPFTTSPPSAPTLYLFISRRCFLGMNFYEDSPVAESSRKVSKGKAYKNGSFKCEIGLPMTSDSPFRALSTCSSTMILLLFTTTMITPTPTDYLLY